jgi:hypothetical protein
MHCIWYTCCWVEEPSGSVYCVGCKWEYDLRELCGLHKREMDSIPTKSVSRASDLRLPPAQAAVDHDSIE